MSKFCLSRFVAAALIAVSGAALVTASFDAEARRAGGGSSVGRQSSNVTQQRQATTPPAAANNTAGATAAAGLTAAAEIISELADRLPALIARMPSPSRTNEPPAGRVP